MANGNISERITAAPSITTITIVVGKCRKVSTKDMDKHFDRIKLATAQAVKRVEEKSLEIKQKIDDDELEEIEKVANDKFMKIKDKFKKLVKK